MRPTCKASKFKEYGFRKCKPSYESCYYLCTADSKMLFVSDLVFIIFNWEEDDPRIHAEPNYTPISSDEVLYFLIKDGLLEPDNRYLYKYIKKIKKTLDSNNKV